MGIRGQLRRQHLILLILLFLRICLSFMSPYELQSVFVYPNLVRLDLNPALPPRVIKNEGRHLFSEVIRTRLSTAESSNR
jgi:hypothetical protein